MKRLIHIVGMLIVAFFVSACIHDVPIDIPEDCTGIEWHYEGHGGPNDWQNLCLGFAACGGRSQSPINIVQPASSSGQGSISLNYAHSAIDIENNGHTIQFNHSSGSTLQWRGESWQLLQFHLHTASEHTVNGISYPMEMHLVHRNPSGELAVVGILFEVGPPSTFLAPFMGSLPASKGQKFQSSSTYTVRDVFPAALRHYQYDGSLTTPPCTQGVNWIVLQETVTASLVQLNQLQAIMHQNNRPVQPLNGRQVKRFD